MYAVIFCSKKRQDADEYEEVAERIAERASTMTGFIRMESVRNPDGNGITVCFWQSLEAIRAWKDDLEHQQARMIGKERWYDEYRITVAKVEYEYSDQDDGRRIP